MTLFQNSILLEEGVYTLVMNSILGRSLKKGGGPWVPMCMIIVKKVYMQVWLSFNMTTNNVYLVVNGSDTKILKQ